MGYGIQNGVLLKSAQHRIGDELEEVSMRSVYAPWVAA